MNHKITQIFVPSAVSAEASTFGMALKSIAAFDADGNTNLGAAPVLPPASFKLVFGTGANNKYGTFKSGVIRQSNILSVTKTDPDLSYLQQITYLGFDEVNDFKTPTFKCDEEYVVTLKIDEYWSKGVYQPMIQESVSIKTACCADCDGGCDSLGCSTYMSELASRINTSPLLGKYVTATHVFKGTLPTVKFTLTVADPGNSTAETAVLTTLRSVYASYVTTPSTDIVITADVDGDSDADSLGNTMYELTPLASVTSLPNFNGVAWEKVVVSAGSITACGIKIEGKVLDEFGNACVPDAVPYVFNLVRFQVNVHEGPYNTQDFDIENFCSPIAVTTTQDIKYAIGAKSAMAEMERHYFTNNLPAVAEARYYYNPIYNEDVNQFFYVPTYAAVNGFKMYEITYLEDSPVGFENKTKNVHSVIILSEQGGTNAAAINSLINALTGQSF